MSSNRRARLCPIRPNSDEPEGPSEEEGWEQLDDADVLLATEARSTDFEDKDDEVDTDDHAAVQIPIGIPAPSQPSKAEIERHNLTHINYRSWCPHCVFGRRNNTAHRSRQHSDRKVPLFCADYCFIRDVEDPENLTCLVGKLYPQKAMFASVCDMKGAEDEVVGRLAQFIKSTGITKLVYKSDQEASIRTALEEALRRVGRAGECEPVEAVPESSAIGESASNGRAERAIQSFEDLLRTMKSALETRIQRKIPVALPVMRWLVEHVAGVINRYSVNSEGVTPYQAVHGKRSTLKVVEFGERVLYHVPKRLRAKLTQRYRLGTYLGLAPSSNEHYIAVKNGNVVKTRSVCRVVEQSRWSADAVLGVIGIPSRLCPSGPEDIDAEVEELEDPHADKDAQQRADLEGEGDESMGARRNVIHGRITEKDLRKYGYSERCPRCTDLQRGFRRTQKHHSEECRLRIYQSWKEADDPKYLKIRHLLEPEAETQEPGHVDLEAASEDRVVIDKHGIRHHIPRDQPDDLFAESATPTGPAQPLTPLDRPWTDSQDRPHSGTWDPDGIDEEKVESSLPLHEVIPPDYMDVNEDVDDSLLDDPMVSYLTSLGCCPVEAKARVSAMLDTKPTTFIEMYGRGSINHCANHSRRNLGLKGVGALDLRTNKPDGTPWNFSLRADRRLARKFIEEEDPDWIIGSPPCTSFSNWNHGMNFRKMEPHRVQQMITEGRLHLNFMASLYRRQISRGKYFLHEHPSGAQSWKEPQIIALLKDPTVHSVIAHQCMYGLTTPGRPGEERKAAKKSTRFMTNSVFMSLRLNKTCDGMHEHQPLTGGRCAAAAFYPLPLVTAILLGMKDTREALTLRQTLAQERVSYISAVTDSAGTIPVEDSEYPESSIRRVSGGNVKIKYLNDNFKQKYIDEYTGEVLDPVLARAAIMEELNYFNERVWQIEETSRMNNVQDHVCVRSRWVCCNKGDAQNPDIRCRLVACEVNKDGKQDNFFASTPPLEAKKLLFARYARERRRKGKCLQLSFIDIRKAYFNGIPKRPVYMRFPKELGLPTNAVGKLVRCAYGTRDAGAIWEDTYRGALEDMGFQSGVASPCCFFHPGRNISLVVHGDDFTSLGIGGDLDWLEKELALHFELKIRGRIGEDCQGPQHIRILNRIVTLTKDGLMYEADPRHVDLLASSLGLTAANAVLTPGVKDPNPDYNASKANEEIPASKISPEEHVRSLATHRPTVSFNEQIETFPVIAYSRIYGTHPRFIAATADGWKGVSSHADPFTSKSGLIMQSRHAKLHDRVSRQEAKAYRRNILSQYLHSLRTHALIQERQQDPFDEISLNAPPIESDPSPSSDHQPRLPGSILKPSRIYAARTPPAKKPQTKRAGAKAVKQMERVSSEYTLSPEDATTYRALSARANFLSQDRGDIQYATKELCREFAVPNRNSYSRLKRVGRYLVGKPRMVHRYNFGPGVSDPEVIDIYVDTDFAGCKETRRSTSGGVVLYGGSLVKQWSKTQSTLALSSGEAELHGIASGIAQGIGMRSLSRDLGFMVKIRVHSDATAALGICRRRGLGKIRHLDVTDLWCQEKVRDGTVTLHKVLGAENPADIMTKYVDSPTLLKMLPLMNLYPMEGRSEIAPAAAGCAQ